MTRGSPSCVSLPPDCETAASWFLMTLLGLVVVAALAVVWPIAAHVGGSTSVVRAAVAAGACLAGAEGALVVSRLLREPQYAFHSLLLGMSLRMGVPLFLGLILYLSGSPLANAEFLVYLGGFYAITLTVGVCLSLPLGVVIPAEPVRVRLT